MKSLAFRRSLQGAGVRCRNDRVSTDISHSASIEVSLRVHHKVPQAGIARRYRKGDKAAGERDMPNARHRDSERAHQAGPRALVIGCAAEMVTEQVNAGDKREDVAPPAARSSKTPERVFWSASVGARIFRDDNRKCE